jgi:hypothetical protein
LHGYDLRRLSAFVADSKNLDVIGRGFQMLKWKSHWPLKCARFGQHANIDLAVMLAGNRVQQFPAAHDG